MAEETVSKKQRMAEEFTTLEEGWEIIQKGITKFCNVLEGSSSEIFTIHDRITLYTNVYTLCARRPPYDYSPQLYDKYKEFLNVYIISTVKPALRDKVGECLLRELVKRWAIHRVMVTSLSYFFEYVDRYYLESRGFPSVNEVGISCFPNLVYMDIRAKVRDAVLDLIGKEREGEQIDRSLLRNVRDIIVEIDMDTMDRYKQDFETPLLDDTATYYRSKATHWIGVDSCTDYMLKAEECLEREKDRVANYLASSTEQKLVKVVLHELLEIHATQLLENEHSGCRASLIHDKVEHLFRMYRLYHKIPKGLEPIADIFKQQITAEGTMLVKQAEQDHNSQILQNQLARDSCTLNQVLVEQLNALHDKHMSYVNVCFMNHKLFLKALRNAFEAFCNKSVAGSSSAEYLASFCDRNLKSENKNLSYETIEETSGKALKLLAYMNDKDLFAGFFRKKLARRLLFDRNANVDHERCILIKLKQECGSKFTSNMEGMVRDMMLNRENQTDFEEYLREHPDMNLGIDLTVDVINQIFWPSYKSFNLNLPLEMARCVTVFNEFYKTKEKKKKLTWIYSLGTCQINGKFEQRTNELIVSTPQAATLMLFNSADRLSYSEIKTQLNLTDEHLVRLLSSLSCPKHNILAKEPNTEDISQNDSFTFNSKYNNRKRKIKIPIPPVNERKSVDKEVDEDRRYAIDATIVRIMKCRKSLGHQELFSECLNQLSRKFKPDIRSIKKRIEELISREFMKRDKDIQNLYHYIA